MISNGSSHQIKSNILNPIILKSSQSEKKTLSKQVSTKDFKQEPQSLLKPSLQLLEKKNTIKSLKNSKLISKNQISLAKAGKSPIEIYALNSYRDTQLDTNRDLQRSVEEPLGKTKKLKRIVKEPDARLISKSINKVGKLKPSSEKIILSSKAKESLQLQHEQGKSISKDSKQVTSYTKYISNTNDSSRHINLEIYHPKNTCISIANTFSLNDCSLYSPKVCDLTSRLKSTKTSESQKLFEKNLETADTSTPKPKTMMRTSSKGKLRLQLDAETPEELHFIHVDLASQSKALSKRFEKTHHCYSNSKYKERISSDIQYFEETVDF